MTLAAVFHHEAPVVISDVLLSHIGQPKVALTPTGRFVHPIRVPGAYQPVGFSQKTILLDEDRAVFTGAGNVSTLKKLAFDLRDRIGKGMRPADLESWLESRQGICGRSTSAIVAWLDDRSYRVAKIGTGVRVLPLGNGEQAICCGSGVDWLSRNLIKEAVSLETIGEFVDAERIRFLAVAQTAQHLAQEHFLGMRDAFGAGFQVTYHDGSRFVPVPQVVYLNFLVEHEGGGPTRMTLSGPIVIQRSDRGRLTFELWVPEADSFNVSGETATLQCNTRFLETVVPPLLSGRSEAKERPPLSTGEYVSAQTAHVKDGRLVGLGSFQLAGDPLLLGVTLAGDPNKYVRLVINRELFDSWMTRFNPAPMKLAPN